MLSLDGFNFVLNPEKQKNAGQAMNLSQEPFTLMEVHTLLSEPSQWCAAQVQGQNKHEQVISETNCSNETSPAIRSLCKLTRNLYFQLESSTRNMNTWNEGDWRG